MLTRLAALIALAAAVCAGAVQAQRRPFDLVLRGGRLMDPASGLDGVRHVAVNDGRIAAISTRPLEGREVIDVSGLVIAPGFIDWHAHGQDLESSKWQAYDGVTTALELEGGAPPRRVSQWYAEREGKARLNFGASVSHSAARRNIIATANDPERPGVDKPATPEQLLEIEAL